MSRAYDGMRENEFNQNYFDAWCVGQTGYPLVDACMRALHQHSWINFRMRAMLVSFASYHLWLHWRPTALFLGKHFLDFEPGIHYSQVQMQSGTTGINTVRIYSPIKQVKDQDPKGDFIRSYVPELAEVPAEHIAEPHKMPLSTQSKVGCRIGKDYPKPIVEHGLAYRTARERIYAVRLGENARSDAKRVLRKHGSRKGPARKRS
jgi:deoxyribodipyrimidine photo-lyase